MEGLGTKSMIARAHFASDAVDRFGDVAYDTVAAILNDLTCVGALPLVLNAYFATGSSDWYADQQRTRSLVEGWRRACDDATCTWGGGESPSLSGLVASEEIELAGSAIGLVPAGRDPLLGQELAAGDEIILVASSGLHANGASLARKVAEALPQGFSTLLPSGRAFGDALLEPSLLYVALVRALLQDDHSVHYLSHISGHGLLKLMRPSKSFTYRIHTLPNVPEVLAFLSDRSGLDSASAFRTLNMGAGLAIYCAPGSGAAVVATAEQLGYSAVQAGVVERGARRVVLEPVDVVYASDELRLAPETGAAPPEGPT